jgi:hypothetical protein
VDGDLDMAHGVCLQQDQAEGGAYLRGLGEGTALTALYLVHLVDVRFLLSESGSDAILAYQTLRS